MLAIVIPYFKITFFEVTLQSLANQTDKRFKVYIGNDASLEDPTILIEKFEGQFNLKYKKFENNLGSISLVQQWERCIKMIDDEEWIMILGDDDVLGENVVESWYNNYHQFNTKSNIVRFASKIIIENKEKTNDFFTHQTWESAKDSFYRRYKGQTRSSLSEYIFSKDSYLKFKFHNFPLAWHSDDIAWLEFSEEKPIYTINESLILVRISNLSITGKFNNKNLKDLATIEFLKNIITKKLYLFSNNQRFELLLDFEVIIKKSRKLSFQEWLLLFKLYLNIFKIIPFLKVSRRFLITIFNL